MRNVNFKHFDKNLVFGGPEVIIPFREEIFKSWIFSRLMNHDDRCSVFISLCRVGHEICLKE